MRYTETLHVELCDDGFVEVHLDRVYEKGNRFTPTMYVQSQDVPKLTDAIERFAAKPSVDQTVQLSDAKVEIFRMDPKPEIRLWLKRPEDAPHGGRATMDIAPEKVSSFVTALRAAAES